MIRYYKELNIIMECRIHGVDDSFTWEAMLMIKDGGLMSVGPSEKLLISNLIQQFVVEVSNKLSGSLCTKK